MSETAPREVGSVLPARFDRCSSGSPSSPGRREVSPEGTTTAPGFPPLAATPAQGPAHSGPRCAGSPAVVGIPVALLQAGVRGALGLPREPWLLIGSLMWSPTTSPDHHRA